MGDTVAPEHAGKQRFSERDQTVTSALLHSNPSIFTAGFRFRAIQSGQNYSGFARQNSLYRCFQPEIA